MGGLKNLLHEAQDRPTSWAGKIYTNLDLNQDFYLSSCTCGQVVSEPYIMFAKSIKYQTEMVMAHGAKPEWSKVEKPFLLGGCYAQVISPFLSLYLIPGHQWCLPLCFGSNLSPEHWIHYFQVSKGASPMATSLKWILFYSPSPQLYLLTLNSCNIYS